MAMKILFISAKLYAVEPFGIMSLIPHLLRDGHEVQLMEAEDDLLFNHVAQYHPDIIGYSVCTGAHTYYLELNRSLKEYFPFIAVYGGPHPTFFPTMIEETGVDAICRGEGDEVFAEFCRHYQETAQLKAVPNFSVKTDSGIVHSEKRHLAAQVDDLPFPDRSIYYNTSETIYKHPVKSFIASRGCPFSCSYCFNHAMDELFNGDWKKVRVRTPHNLIDEIVSVVSLYPVSFLAFRESIFPMNKQWLTEFGAEYRSRVNLPFYAHVRLDHIDEESVQLLADAGCYSVNVGIETGNEKIRTNLLGRRMTNKKMIDSSKLLRKHNIRVIANHMLGLPGGTLKNDFETLRLSQQCAPDYPLTMLYQPYPGTKLAAEAVRLGCFDGNYEKISFTYYDNSPLSFRNSTEKRRIENLQKLFALAVMFPILTPAVKLLTYLPKNRFFKAVFSTLYLVFHQSEIFPHNKPIREWAKDFVHVLRSTAADPT